MPLCDIGLRTRASESDAILLSGPPSHAWRRVAKCKKRPRAALPAGPDELICAVLARQKASRAGVSQTFAPGIGGTLKPDRQTG